MKKRVLQHNSWEHVSGNRLLGDFIDTKDLIFQSDTMIFNFEEDERYSSSEVAIF